MEHDLERLRRFGRNIGLFWMAITGAFLVLTTAITFAQSPALVAQSRGWAILSLASGYALWYHFGFRWAIGNQPDRYWRLRMQRKIHLFHARLMIFWVVLVLLSVALCALSANYHSMFWPTFGISLALAPLPGGLVYCIPVMAIIYAEYGWLPQSWRLDNLLSFGTSLVMMSVYFAIVYLPFVLLKGRFERERVYAKLAKSHRELAEAHAQLAESASRDRELAILRERERFARDMHDTLGHSLALMAVKLDAAQRLRPVDAERADHEVAATQAIARVALADLRSAIADLRSPIVSQDSLGTALVGRARELAAHTGWIVETAIQPDLGALAACVHEALLRIGGEALTNAERHAHARHVRLALRRECDMIVLRVEDDGRGIMATNPPLSPVTAPARHAKSAASADDLARLGSPPPGLVQISSPPGHFGIRGMRERAAALGGTFSIDPTSETGGTVVEARIPIRDV
jgi:signal transduction histidine kinase